MVAYYSGDKERLYNSAGSISRALANDSMKEAGKHLGRDVMSAIDRNFGQKSQFAACRAIVVKIPTEAKFKGYRFVRVFGNNYRTCSRSHVTPNQDPTGDCDWSRFEYEPKKLVEAEQQIWHTVFAAWSHDQTFNGRLMIFYEMPTGKDPEPVEGM